jgi:hypothetical protein
MLDGGDITVYFAEPCDQEVPAHAMLALGVADDGLDDGAPAEVVLDRIGDVALLAGDVVGRRVAAGIAAVGDDAARLAPI